MPLLDDITRNKIIADYRNDHGEPDFYSEKYSSVVTDDIWETGGSHNLDMDVALGTDVDPFLPQNPLLTDEPNYKADTEYDLENLGGWIVIVGTTHTHIYVVRRTDAQYLLRDAVHSPETTYHLGGTQVRRRSDPKKHLT